MPWDFEYRDLLEDYVADFTLLLRAEHTEACRERAAQLVAVSNAGHHDLFFRPSLTVFPLSTHLQHVYNYAQTRAEGDTALELAVDMMQVWCARLGESGILWW